MVGYVWSTKAQERGEDRPLKERDHFCLVAGTAVTTLLRGEVPIEDVRCGDRVLTRSGWHPVLASGRTARNVETVTVATTGKLLTGTPDHPVWTVERGWQRMDALRYGDTLVSCDPRSSSSGFGFAAVRVVSVTPTGRADVFNLAVDGAHEFFANRVLVHNCDALRYGSPCRTSLACRLTDPRKARP